jgi:hypothetical protein
VDPEIGMEQKVAQLILFERIMLKHIATSYMEKQLHVVSRQFLGYDSNWKM